MAFEGNSLACNLYGIISNDCPVGLLQDHLINKPKSLKNLGKLHKDGWGIAYYLGYGEFPIIERSAEKAFTDTNFDYVVNTINLSKPKITIAHIRSCSSGCCDPGNETIENPHPFYRIKNDNLWTFAHNGGINKNILFNLIGDDYLNENPPNGSDIPACDPSNPDLIVDSELYFIFLLKNIEKNNWNVINGIIDTINELDNAGITRGINFIISNGYGMWLFRCGNTLYYLYDAAGTGYTAFATKYPSSTLEDWTAMNNYEIAVASAASPPRIIDITCAGDFDGDKDVDGTDLAAFAIDFSRTDCSSSSPCNGDFDGSGYVDNEDLIIFASHFGLTRCIVNH